MLTHISMILIPVPTTTQPSNAVMSEDAEPRHRELGLNVHDSPVCRHRAQELRPCHPLVHKLLGLGGKIDVDVNAIPAYGVVSRNEITGEYLRNGPNVRCSDSATRK